jgi:hypothetical protein
LHPPDEELVGNALRQRRFGTDDGEVNPLLLGELSQSLDIGGLDIQVLGNLSRAGVARSNVDFFDLGALG